MIFVNFKTYKEGSGENALYLVKVIEEVASKMQIKIIPVVQAADVKEVVSISKLEIWTQHIDPIEYGAHTGAIIPEAVYEDGASGTFLNHSERRFKDFSDLELANNRAKKVGLRTLIFTKDLRELDKVLELKPDYVSYEPPELVGSLTTSVAREKPEVISKAVEISKQKGIPLIVGAGIKDTNDVRVSLSLGASGIAVASDVVKAENPGRELQDLVEGFL